MKKEPTEAQSVRLPVSHWAMLRALMTHYKGRIWLEKAVAREYKKAGIDKVQS